MRIKGIIAKGLLIAFALTLTPTSTYGTDHAGPKTPSCGNFKVTKNEVIVGVKFPKGTYQINTFGISCSKVMGSKGLFSKFLKLKNKDPLPKPWRYLADAVGAPKFSSGPGVGFRVQLLTATSTPAPKPPIAKPTPTPAPPPTPVSYVPPSVTGDSVQLCKLQEASQRRGYTFAGFPLINKQYLQSIAGPVYKTGTIKWALIPVDFADLPGDIDWRLRLEKETELLSEWFELVSEGKLKVEWVIADSWIRLPGVSSDYPVTKVRGLNNTPGGIKLFQTAMVTADPHVDFTNVQTVNFMLPMNQEIAKEGENGFPWDPHVKDLVTNEGRISSFTISGKYQTRPDTPLWAYWMHEAGHGMEMPHVGGGGPEPSPFNEWDIMGGQDGPSLELSGWLRFLTGWLPDEKVYCKDSQNLQSVEIMLAPLSGTETGVKLAIFPLSATKALLVESRRVTKFSCTTPTPRNGVLVYVLDLTLGHGQDFLIPVSPPNRITTERFECNGFPSYSSLDVLLHEGDKVSYGGLTVELNKSSNLDKIIVTRP